MKINFLTTSLSDASGGAIYDKNFYEILAQVFPDVQLFDDIYFEQKYNQGSSLLSFNEYYKKSALELLCCDYLIMNSRLYTRFLKFNFKKLDLSSKPKIIIIHHHSNFMNHMGLMRLVHMHFESKLLKNADELVIPNEYVVNQVKHDFNCTNIKFLPSSFEKKVYSISNLNSRYLLFVGNIEYRKGVIYGLKAFKYISRSYPDYKYRLVGKYEKNDVYFKKLNHYIEKNNLQDKVIFEGRVSKERLDWLYSNAELFLFPSLLEGYGWVMAEAMGRGVPVVAFDNSAMPYTVKDGYNGLLIANKSSENMAKRVIDLLGDRGKMKSLQNGALESYNSLPSQDDLNNLTREYFVSWKS